MKAGWTKETVNVIEGGSAGNAAWAIGDYALIESGENEGKQLGGKYGLSAVSDGDGWHVVMLVANSIPPKP
jgi:hypothetical protein